MKEIKLTNESEFTNQLRNLKGSGSLAALFEVSSSWFSIMAVGSLAIAMLVMSFRTEDLRTLQRSRLNATLTLVSERLENDLMLGIELRDDQFVQQLIDDLIRRDPGLRTIDVLDVNGISLFNTDRGSIGEHADERWLNSAAKVEIGKPWYVDDAEQTLLGLTLAGPFGEAGGYLVATINGYGQAEFHEIWLSWAVLLLIVAGASPGLAVWSVRGLRQSYTESLCLEGLVRLEQAAVRVHVAVRAFDDVNAGAK